MGLNNKNTTKGICFTGIGYEDILLYMISILKELGKKPLITDFTQEHVFYSCIPHIDGIDPKKELLDIVNAYYAIADTKAAAQVMLLGKDNPSFKIALQDLNTIVPESEYIIIVSDEHRIHIEALEQSVEALKGWKSCLIIRNYTGVMKKRIERIASGISCERLYVLPVSEKDYRNAVMAEYMGNCRFTHISSDMQELLRELILGIFDELAQKEYRQAYKRGSKGGKK